MSFDLLTLALAGIGYLLLLFGVAHAADRGWLPEGLARHPLVYTLSLGVFTSSWVLFGTVWLAQDFGYGYLAYYVGTAAVFMFSPLVLVPLARVCRLYQLNSLPDVFTFRYRSPGAGTVVTLLMALGIMPLLSLQIQVVTDSLHILVGNGLSEGVRRQPQDNVALVFCIVIAVFAILFGSREGRHPGLVVALAFESLVKLMVLLLLGGVAVFSVLGGFDGMERWLAQHPVELHSLKGPLEENISRTLLLVYFAAAIAMPHSFHMVFAERPGGASLGTASWAFPLVLLLMSLPVLPILWAGNELGLAMPTTYFSLGIGAALDQPWLTLLVYLVGLSAASGAMITITLALASMWLNHLILPFYQPDTGTNLYRWLRWIRRVLIALILLITYIAYRLVSPHVNLTTLGLTAFTGTLQFLPGIVGVLYWTGANRRGLIAGLIGGFGVWAAVQFLPAIRPEEAHWVGEFATLLVGDQHLWGLMVVSSLGVNVLLFVLVSLLWPASRSEQGNAELCAMDELNRPSRRQLSAKSVREFEERLAAGLGKGVAEREVQRALTDLRLTTGERRPYQLRRLRDRVEANLSGLMGPAVAQELVDRLLPYSEQAAGDGEDLYLIESRLETYKRHLTGLAGELDNLRRFHRQTLQDLPIGVCALGADFELLMWNGEMEELTGIGSTDVLGSHLDALAEPWRGLLRRFVEGPSSSLLRQPLEVGGRRRWISLYKTEDDDLDEQLYGTRLIVVQDVTETQLLEQELMHSERLASIGRLAAGVAHEIGNPVTGIACLAQNLKLDTDQPEILETAEEILRQTQRVSRIVHSLVSFAHGGRASESSASVPVDVRQCADEAIHLLKLNKDARQVEFINQCPPGSLALGDPQQLLQVLINLLSNARDASPEGSPIVVDAAVVSEEEILITVTDQGVGIPPEHMDTIFEPFFTTKEAGQGTGLGLSLVYSIVDEHGGYLSVDSPAFPERGCGTRIGVRLRRPVPTVGQAAKPVSMV